MKETIEIPLNKRKVGLYGLGAFVLTALGSLFVLAAVAGAGAVGVRLLLGSIGLLAVLFFGLITIVLGTKLLSQKIGLVFREDGLVDATSGLSAGFIAWRDVRQIGISTSGGASFMIIYLKNPEKHLKNQKNPLKRQAMALNHRLSGSPVHIWLSVLDMTAYEVYQHATEQWQQMRKGTP